MPIYEFKCLACNEVVEFLVTSKDEKIELKCPKCESEHLERILSVAGYSLKCGSSAEGKGAFTETKKCSSGSCTTYNIPGVA